MLLATADLALLLAFVVVLVAFVVAAFVAWKARHLPGPLYQAFRAWDTDRKLREETLKQERLKTALLEEQLRNEQVRTFLSEKKERK